MRTIGPGDRGAAVEDVQRRLRGLGFDVEIDGAYLKRTEEAVSRFRESEGLPEGTMVDGETWAALVDATFSLGDRMLYLRMPYFHGCDVRDLQNILNALGFACGDPDGIFGAHTEHALRDFQASAGLVDDGVAGNTSFDAIERLRHAWEGKSAASNESFAHMGFARAAETLEKMEACFFGMDEVGRHVASRVANLAQATTSVAHVASADSLGGIPPQTMLLVGIGTEGVSRVEGTPVLILSDDFSFVQRLRTALESAQGTPRRIQIEVSAQGTPSAAGSVDEERWEQHLAVLMLDAFCSAFS